LVETSALFWATLYRTQFNTPCLKILCCPVLLYNLSFLFDICIAAIRGLQLKASFSTQTALFPNFVVHQVFPLHLTSPNLLWPLKLADIV
jgi:hypothetical protein